MMGETSRAGWLAKSSRGQRRWHMDIVKMLKKKKVPFERMQHTPAFTAQELAATEHVTGDDVAKVVVVRAGDRFAMFVLPASYNMRFDRVDQVLGTDGSRLATENELSTLFSDCELGAMPPFGHEYGMDVYVDRHLAEDDQILFEAGHHDEAIRMSWADYQKIERPQIVDFATHLH
jgi:Ala-tRNA(Pro) deacylase